MAITSNTISTRIVSNLYVDFVADVQPITNITGAAGTCWGGEIVNTMNPNTAIWLKLYDNASPTNGTAPYAVVYAGPGQTARFVFPEGLAFGTAISAICATSPLVSTGSSPANKATIKLLLA